MPRTTAPRVVDHTGLAQSGGADDAILAGSPAWYAWLEHTTSFAFTGQYGSFTAYKERRGPSREYWKAYRHRAGKLYRAYLGKSAELTLERLNAVAAELAGDVLTPTQVSQDRTRGMTDTATDLLSSPLEPVAELNQADDPQSPHLLATKLAIPPSRPNLVPRPRLVERLDAVIRQGQKLLLISAPAGSGKTTLLVEWLAGRQKAKGKRQNDSGEILAKRQNHSDETLLPSTFFLLPWQVAWLSLDDHDNHLAQFLAYLIAALETVRLGAGAEAWTLLRTRAAQPPVHAILTTLVNALVDPADPLLLVLDDYHTITLQAIHEALAFLLDRMPPQMHIIVTSRGDPPLPLAQLRVRGSLTEVRAADLRFTHGEMADLFARVHQVRLSSDALTTLEERTEGWAAGLQLAALSLQHQDAAHIPLFLADFSGSHTYVFDYLAAEVFRRQPDALRTFLMQTAILERLCGPLCAAVTGQDDAQALLEHLDQANLFLIRLDSHRHWYRYHQLFRDFLSECLERAVGEAGRVLLHRRASAWFEQAGLPGEAIDHALSARAWEDAIRYLTPLMASERMYEYILDWPRWLAALPDGVLQDDPNLCLRLAWILMFTGHDDAAERPLALAEAVWQAAGNQSKVGEVLSRRAFACYWRRDSPRAIQLAHQALARLPAEAVEQRAIACCTLGISNLDLGHLTSALDQLLIAHAALQGCSETFFSLAAATGLARAYQLQGHMQRAAALYQDVIRRGGSARHHTGPAPYIFLGGLFYEWNDLTAAEYTLREGIVVGRRTGRDRYWPRVYNALAQVLWARGDATQAHTMSERSQAAAQLLGSPRDIADAQAQRIGWLVQGDLPAAVRWLAARTLDADAQVAYERQAEYLMLARIRIAQERQAPGSGDLDAVVRLLERLLRAAEADERLSDRIAILALLALAHAARHDSNQALPPLAAVLALAEQEGYIRTFVDEGEPMRSLLLVQRAHLPESQAGTRLRTYIDRLVDAFSPPVSAAPRSSPPPPLLSDRERTILQLLADGRSLQEIATGLIISVHTARTHVKHIYAKLDAHNRVQALERARALQLL